MHLIAKSDAKIIASSPAAATNFPTTHLYDGIPSRPFRHSSAANNSQNDADLNRAVNGNFEDWGTGTTTPSGWTKEGSTTTVQETSSPIEGTISVRVAGQIYRDYKVPSGARIALRVKMARYTGGTADAKFQLFDQVTGEWLHPDGTWTTGSTSLWIESDVLLAGRTKGIVFTARPFSLVQADVTTLRVRLLCGSEGGADEGIFDELSIVVVPNLMAVHGYNAGSKFDPRLRSSRASTFADRPLLARMVGNPFAARDASAIGMRRQPSFYFRLEDNCPVFRGTERFSLVSGVSARADSKLVTISFWIRKDGDDGVLRTVLVCHRSDNSLVLQVDLPTTNAIQLRAFNGTPTLIIDVVSTAESLPPDTNWHHIIFSVDTTAGTPFGKVYIDRVNVTGTETITTDGLIDLSAISQIRVGGSLTSPDLRAALNELYVQPAFGPDLSVSTNLDKFIVAGDRINLGDDGSIPDGNQAWLYQYGTEANPITDFAINRGDGGGPFTVEGTFDSELMYGPHRFWRLNFSSSGTVGLVEIPLKAIELGQWVLTRTVNLLRTQRMPHPSPRTRPHVEQRSPSDQISRVAMSYADIQGYTFLFRNTDEARDLWLELTDRTAGGTLPVVIVPDTDRPEVHFGFLSVDYDEERRLVDSFPVTLRFEELPFVEDLVESS